MEITHAMFSANLGRADFVNKALTHYRQHIAQPHAYLEVGAPVNMALSQDGKTFYMIDVPRENSTLHTRVFDTLADACVAAEKLGLGCVYTRELDGKSKTYIHDRDTWHPEGELSDQAIRDYFTARIEAHDDLDTAGLVNWILRAGRGDPVAFAAEVRERINARATERVFA